MSEGCHRQVRWLCLVRLAFSPPRCLLACRFSSSWKRDVFHAMTYRYLTRWLRLQTALKTDHDIFAMDYGTVDFIHIQLIPDNILVCGQLHRKSH